MTIRFSKSAALVVSFMLLMNCDLFFNNKTDTSDPSDEDNSTETPVAVDSPVISPSGGYYEAGPQVSIVSETDTEIWYTLDGSDPVPGEAILYGGPFSVSKTSSVKAVSSRNTSVSLPSSEQYYIENNEFQMIIRDFRGYSETGTGDGYINGRGHADFENTLIPLGQVSGLVADTLDDDGSIVIGNITSGSIQSADSFYQWFTTISGVNLEIPFTFSFDETSTGKSFGGLNFFPIDDAGYGNTTSSPTHNFNFTTCTRLKLYYQGNETITFTGDDDVWIFLNNKLIIDIGGVHASMSSSFTIDSVKESQLGLEKDKVYDILIFQAERHTTQSNYTLVIDGKIVTE